VLTIVMLAIGGSVAAGEMPNCSNRRPKFVWEARTNDWMELLSVSILVLMLLSSSSMQALVV